MFLLDHKIIFHFVLSTFYFTVSHKVFWPDSSLTVKTSSSQPTDVNEPAMPTERAEQKDIKEDTDKYIYIFLSMHSSRSLNEYPRI